MTEVAQNAPLTLSEALDPDWLSGALASLTGGATVTRVETVEVIRTVATKVRFKVQWAVGNADLCLKAFLDMPEGSSGAATRLVEADFYDQLAPRMSVRRPPCVAAIADRRKGQGIVIMRDLIADGAAFCTALEPFSVEEAAESLGQLARVHAAAPLLDSVPWVGRRIADLIAWKVVSVERLQELLDGARGEWLDVRTRDAERLTAALHALRDLDAAQPATLVHGDCHAGNIYRSKDGPGLIDWQMIQRGGWALDVAYHICAVLPAEMAEAHEWELLDRYLDEARRLGVQVPDSAAARARYRTAATYGYYLWAITTRVDPTITEVFVDRLGKAVQRLESFRALGV